MKNIGYRYLLLGAAFLFSLISTAQTLEETVRLSSIVPLEGYSADLLFSNANSYLTPVTKAPKKKKKKVVESPVIIDKENYRVSIPKEIKE